MGLFPIVQDPVLAAADRCSAGWMNSNVARGIWASDATIEGEVASHSLAVNIVTTSARHKATITHRQSRDCWMFVPCLPFVQSACYLTSSLQPSLRSTCLRGSTIPMSLPTLTLHQKQQRTTSSYSKFALAFLVPLAPSSPLPVCITATR